MFFSTTKKAAIIRNYIILSVFVMLIGAGLTDVFKKPSRIGQQDRLDSYFRYINVGLVNQAQKLGR